MIQETRSPLRIAFIGGGCNSAIGYTHFNASRLDGYFSVEAGCFSRDALHNKKSALAYGVSKDRTYSTWHDLLTKEKSRIDAVVVLTPITSHAEIVQAAVNNGVPVICEKALGISSAECLALDDLVNKKQGYLAVTLNYSGYPMVRQLRKMVSEQRLGQLQQILIEMPQESFLRDGSKLQSWRSKDYVVPTVSLDLGVHVHHLVNFLSSGLKPLRVTGDQSCFGRFKGLVDNIFCIAQYEQGVKVQAWWGKAALGHRNGLRIRVYGSEASAEWYQMNPELLHWSDNDGHNFTLDRSSGEAKLAQEDRYNRFKAGHPSGFIEAFANLYADIAEELRAYKQGDQASSSFVFGANHAAEGLQLIEDIHSAATERSWIDCM